MKHPPDIILGSLMNKSSLIRFFAVVMGLISIIHLQAMNQKKMIVCVPVADMRTGPGPMPEGIIGSVLSKDTKTPGTDISQDSQLLLNEPVFVLEDDTSHPGWYKVQALFQPGFEDGKWTYCSGYVESKQLYSVDEFPKYSSVLFERQGNYSLGIPAFCLKDVASFPALYAYYKKYIDVIPKWFNLFGDQVYEKLNELRKKFVCALLTFVGCPYVWGGCSSHVPNTFTGVDCSALGHLSMRAVGLIIPRNSHAQYLKSVEVESAADLKPGDAIYLRRKDRERMNHVLFYLGGEEFIEAFSGGASVTSRTQVTYPEEIFKTRIVLTSEAFGCSLSELSNGREFLRLGTPTVMYLRTFFPSKEYVQSLRDAFLMINQV